MNHTYGAINIKLFLWYKNAFIAFVYNMNLIISAWELFISPQRPQPHRSTLLRLPRSSCLFTITSLRIVINSNLMAFLTIYLPTIILGASPFKNIATDINKNIFITILFLITKGRRHELSDHSKSVREYYRRPAF